MTLWWIGNIVFLVVIIPVVIAILSRVLRPAIEIKRYADDLEESGRAFAGNVRPLDDIARTRELVSEVAAGLERYRKALDDIV